MAYSRSGRGIRAGEDILAFGYPLKSVLSGELKGTKGMINALSGLHNDTRFMQMSAPVQSGNSGGPLLDQAGNVVGVVTAQMDAVKMAKYTAHIPQNVNFALKASLVRDMLEAEDIDYETGSSKRELKTVDFFDKTKQFTVLVECFQLAD
jgi:S1-C subfamily serine protease